MMRLTVNGEPRVVPEGLTLARLVDHLGLTAGRLACEVNGSVVRRQEYDALRLKDGDLLEIVQMIGGG